MAIVRLCRLTDVAPGAIQRVEIEGRPPLAVALADGEPIVFDDTCPHADESLSKGWIEDGRVVCAVHFAEFEIGSGGAHNAPVGCGPLRFYRVEIRGDEIFADVADKREGSA
jgi:3-phenylpropionate/trans-cinnamate dioxygenase ferredoxin subunit